MTGRCPCGAKYFPFFFSSILVISIFTSFVIAVAQSDITPWFPAISDTATKSPESNIFSQLINISTFVGLILMYVRYLQVKRDVEWLQGNQTTLVLNRHSLSVGLIALLGCSIVANFPETQVPIVHVIGATILFVFGNIYVWFQVMISFHMKKMGFISSCVNIMRLIFAVLSTISFVLTFVMVSIASKKKSGDNLHWHSNEPGYVEHVIGDAFEWLMVFSFLLVFLTFTKELQQSRLQFRLVGNESSYDPVPSQSEHVEV